ncbi:MAG: GNAT family N-acetyltransferase [Candidatus Omnitrophica bacterium]|nr:GNAT family N-acetyltransferase [Candidatus Omnitrophota bacterium]MDE2223105.1 GNAT family N-acetyltransferase [Candidatus Omnitrophota bacterium]
MQEGILTLEDRERWIKYLGMLPEGKQDVYLGPDYYALYQTPEKRVECFFAEEGGKVFLYPYLKTHINRAVDFELDGDFYDIEGAYGYNGFAVSDDDADFSRRCAGIFAQYCSRERIVAEFMRLNPLWPMPGAESWWDLKPAKKNVYVDLTLSPEDLWMDSYEHCVRKNVNKARQMGVEIRSYEGRDMDESLLGEFLNIYHHTMERNNSGADYFFSQDYFRKVCSLLPRQSLFFFAYLNGQPVSCELVLISKKNAYSFLGGTLQQAQASRPNNLLKHELILHLQSLHLERYLLGGGKSENDGIFGYKKTFSKKGVLDFSIACKVCDHNAYEEICRLWREKFPSKQAEYANYFLKYRC